MAIRMADSEFEIDIPATQDKIVEEYNIEQEALLKLIVLKFAENGNEMISFAGTEGQCLKVTRSTLNEIERDLRDGRVVAAIKAFRTAAGCDLKNAKYIVDIVRMDMESEDE